MKPQEELSAQIKVVGLDGSLLYSSENKVNVAPDSVLEVEKLDFSVYDSPVCFISLEVKDKKGNVVSRNFYWRGREYMDYKAMNTMPEVVPSVKVTKSISDGKVTLNCRINNDSSVPMVNLRLLVLDPRTGERVLPIDYEDNYISLIPGQEREGAVSFDSSSCRSGKYALYIEGWNVPRSRVLY